MPPLLDQSQNVSFVQTMNETLKTQFGQRAESADVQIRVVKPAVPTAGEVFRIDTSPNEVVVLDLREWPPQGQVLLGGSGYVIVLGNGILRGSALSHTVVADAGVQSLVLGPNDDVLYGGAGNDVVGSTTGDDALYGQEGDDWLVGGVGNDSLYGGEGNDILQGGVSDAGRWRVYMAEDGTLSVHITHSQAALAGEATRTFEGRWATADGKGSITDPRLTWVYQSPELLKDVALLFHGVLGRLPSMKELSEFANGSYSSVQLAQGAHELWQGSAGVASDPSQQLQALAQHLFGQTLDQATLQAGLGHLQAGGTWGELWLMAVRSSAHQARMPADPSGAKRLGLVDQQWGEAGWMPEAGNNQLFGGAGNDVLIPGTGHSTIDGGAGTDVVVLMGAVSDYQLAYQPSHTLQLRHMSTGVLHTLQNVEWLQVGGKNYALQAAPMTPTLAESTFGSPVPYLTLLGVADVSAVQFHADWVA